MGASIWDGPLYSTGSMTQYPAAYGSAVPDYNLDAGASMFYKSYAIPDVRFPFPKDNMQGFRAVFPGHLSSPNVILVDAIPAAAGSANIAAAQATTAATAMTLVTAGAAGIAPGVPIFPYGGSNAASLAATSVLALDFGFTTVSTTSASKNVTVSDSTKFISGMPLVIANVGNAAGTTALLTFVTSITSATVIVINDAALATNATAACGTGNMWGPNEVGAPPGLPTAAQPYMETGPMRVLDPTQALCRGVGVLGSSSSSAMTFTVAGYDIYGQAMTETITHVGGAVTIWGKKAFKYIASVTPSATDSHTWQVQTSDVFGINLRADEFEIMNSWWAAVGLTAVTGFVAAVTTTPTATTGDVRGTLQASAIGPTATGASASTSNGARRLHLRMAVPVWNMLFAYQGDPTPLYGATQA